MPPEVDNEQPATLLHRNHFWGRPSGSNSVSWAYQEQPLQIQRPDDGSPAQPCSVQCQACSRTLTYRVHSVAATQQRRQVWQGFALLGLAVTLVSGAVLCSTFDDSSVPVAVITMAGFFGGSVLGWVCWLAADGENGVTGHGNSWPGATKHRVAGAELPPDDPPPVPDEQPELVCPRCGHREEYPHGSDYRASFVAEEYEAAKARLDQHRCRR